MWNAVQVSHLNYNDRVRIFEIPFFLPLAVSMQPVPMGKG
jgi:hypothetical protein